MALVNIGAVGIVSTSTNTSTVTYSNIDDNKTVKNFYYPAKLGFMVQSDTLGIITMGGKTPYIFWS